MSIIFETRVEKIGDLVADLAKDQMFVLFDHGAPKELHEISILHANQAFHDEIQMGDTFVIDGEEFDIWFVGGNANKTIKELGHVTIKYQGCKDDMPGTICIEPKPVPPIEVGTKIAVIRK